MAAARFRAIIFDIGRVLIRIDLQSAMSGLAENVGLSPEEIWSALEKHPSWLDWQEGRITARDFYLGVSKRFGVTLTFEQFVAVWNRVLDPRPIQDDAFLGKLAKKYRLCLLSNTDPIHVAHMERTYDFFRYFPNRIYSCAVGVSKPNPLIYRAALETCKVSAQDAIYIDDIAGYAEAARRLGLSGIVFQSPQQLAGDLQTLGVETGE
ncbi:MAG TPA: HAD family phosphatase [Candidatus Acidoferrum sp.]|nr:HAD family phosphatase [Candidatus Acidoferrum sp.]